MGKLIFCSGTRTKRPYLLTQVGLRVYSMEELCYCLYNQVYLIDEDMFCDALFDFITVELKLPERADKLRLLKMQGADIKTMVTVVLCSTDYYTEQEIKALLKTLDGVIGMPMVKRSCIKAGNYLKEHQYLKATSEYERIINSKDAAELTPEEYGDLYHNLGVARIHITGLKEATKLFHQAYERNHREESLIQYLLALKLSGNHEEYEKSAEEYQIGAELDSKIRDYLSEIDKNAEESDIMKEINELKEIKKHGSRDEFYKRTEDMIALWKDSVRQC